MAHEELRRGILALRADGYMLSTEDALQQAMGLLSQALHALGGPVLWIRVEGYEALADHLLSRDNYPLMEWSHPTWEPKMAPTGTPGCPVVDAVSSVEGGTDCSRDYSKSSIRDAVQLGWIGPNYGQADRETVELINRQIHGRVYLTAEDIIASKTARVVEDTFMRTLLHVDEDDGA